jgi:hypothetical protein
MSGIVPAGAFKPYVYGGTGESEPPAVAAARLRHRAINAEIEQRALAAAIAVSDTAGPGPDDAGYEWRREQLAEEVAPAAPAAAVPEPRAVVTLTGKPPAPAVAPAPPVSLAEWVWCDGCGYLTSACRCTAGDELAVAVEAAERYQEAQAALDRQPEPAAPDPEPAPVPVAVKRCKGCGYLKTSVGHKVACDG